MKKLCLSTVCLFVVAACIHAQSLKFRPDSTFKIVQFTDTHICPEKLESANAINVIRQTLAAEKPDLIIFTGDVVTGKPAKAGWEMVLRPVVESKIPFCVVLGNHDDEQDISRETIARLVTACPNNLNKLEAGCLADFAFPVKYGTKNKTEALLYAMDSNTYSKMDTVKGYGWFSFDQVAWYRKTSAEFTRQNNGRPLPALVFFHIPLPEYKQAYENKQEKHTGIRSEEECSPKINSGMFSAFLECGDVMGTFVGHDHDNSYAASLFGIHLCYGRFSGGETTYIHLPNGARIIELKVGKRGFDTWVRLYGGKIIDRISY